MKTPVRGRPRVQETADDMVAAVLAVAGARVSTPAYTTRRIAELTGLSQTLVSRAVRRIRYPGRDTVATTRWSHTDLETGPPLQLADFHVAYPSLTLRFEPVNEETGPARYRVFERRAAALMAALRVSGASEWLPVDDDLKTDEADRASAEPGDGGIPQRVERQESCETAARDKGISPVSMPLMTVHWQPGSGDWKEFLSAVAQRLEQCRPFQDGLPAELMYQLAIRAGRGLHGLAWSRGPLSDKATHSFDSNIQALAESPAPGRTVLHTRRMTRPLSATEQIAIVLRKEMASSGFRAGDRLSVSQMAEPLRLSHARVRNAMRQLADDGLLAHSEEGFRIPHVTGTDVIDLYASRLHVGMVILRSCATQPRQRLLRARLALAALEAVAEQGSLVDAGEADLRFQQELADASGLQQSAHSFHALTLRLRMFISVLQLDYSPAVDRLVIDDRRLLTTVLNGRADEAVQIWRSKVNDAVRQMSALAPAMFDPQLWSRLTT